MILVTERDVTPILSKADPDVLARGSMAIAFVHQYLQAMTAQPRNGGA